MAQLAPKVKDHFLNPRNVGKIDNPSVEGASGDPFRGSGIRLFIKLSPEGRIERMTYQIFNNAPAIAPASAFTELAIGKTLSEVSAIDRAAIMVYLDCDENTGANIRYDILDAFAHALAVLHGEAELPRPPEARPATAPAAPRPAAASPASSTAPGAAMASGKPKLMVMQLIQDVLDTEIRPAIAMDGGDVELVDVDDRRIVLRFHGHCVGCSSSNTTMRFFIEDRLRELVDPGIEVVDATAFEGETHAPPGFFGNPAPQPAPASSCGSSAPSPHAVHAAAPAMEDAHGKGFSKLAP